MTDAGGASERSGVEQELKYRLRDARHADRYAALRELGELRATGRPRRITVEDRYLDTADRRLARAGLAVRLRSAGGHTTIAVKSAAQGGEGALHRRDETEGPGGPSLDPAAWPPSAARARVEEAAGGAPLAELVTIRQVRRLRNLAADGAAVELSVDEAEVVRHGHVIGRFLELEVELRSGGPDVLAAAMGVLSLDRSLVPADVSKLERALAIAAAADPNTDSDDEAAFDAAPIKAPVEPVAAVAAPPAATSAEGSGAPKLVVGKTPGVTADDLLAEAGRKVLRFHFAAMLAKEEGTRTGSRIEDLKGMRVATRRQRAAWRVYGDAFRAGRTKKLRLRLREVAGRLGAVRDLDVLIDGLRAYGASLPGDDGALMEPLVAAWAADRDVARAVLIRTFDAPWYARWLEEYRAFVSSEGVAVVAPASPVTPHHVRDQAGTRIWAAYETVRGYEPVLRWAPVETLHELRIAAKWLRYTIEFFREALGPEVEQCIARVVALQDHLGFLHDADVTIALTRQFLLAQASSLTPAQAEAMAVYLEGREAELERLRRSVGVPWRGVAGLPFRRLLGRAVSAL